MFKGAAMICLFLQRRLARLDESGEKSRGTYLFNICQCEKKCTEHFVITSFSVGAGASVADPDPVGSGPFCRIRIRSKTTGSGFGSGLNNRNNPSTELEYS